MAQQAAAAAAGQAGKVPVTIITGFLGAGKTTLLNYILKEKGDKHVSVIENEFGEVNIDRELVADNLLEQEDLVSLENGCVCCSLRKDIVKAFAEIDKRSRQRGRKPDCILLETTGLADPAPVAFTFFANPWIASRFRLDSILCVVDARHLLQHLGDAKSEGTVNEAAQQLAFADLILLNKVDLVSAEQLEDVKTVIRKINSTANVIECQLTDAGNRPPLDKLLGVNMFSVDRALEVDPDFLASDDESDDELLLGGAFQLRDDHGQPSTAGQGTSHSDRKRQLCDSESECEDNCERCISSKIHKGERKPKRQRKKLHDLSDVSSVGIVARGPLDEYRFNMFMRDLLTEKAKDIFRSKGVLCVHGYGDQKFVFQGVHETICYGPAEKSWGPNEQRLNQIVLIGRGIDRKELIEGFRTCVWVPLPDGWEEFRDPVTKQPYYFNKATGEKTWKRPEAACAHVKGTSVSMKQPQAMQPRKSTGSFASKPADSVTAS